MNVILPAMWRLKSKKVSPEGKGSSTGILARIKNNKMVSLIWIRTLKTDIHKKRELINKNTKTIWSKLTMARGFKVSNMSKNKGQLNKIN